MLTESLALNLIQSSEQFPINFDDAWKWIEYSRKDNAKVSLLNIFLENVDFLIIQEPTTTGIQANQREKIYLTVDCLKSWAMMTGTAKGKEVRKYFIECERKLKTQFKLPQNYLEALKALTVEIEQKQIAQAH